jgi:hypothetical protein
MMSVTSLLAVFSLYSWEYQQPFRSFGDVIIPKDTTKPWMITSTASNDNKHFCGVPGFLPAQE